MTDQELIKEYTKYYNQFDTTDEAIKRKYYHSIRVMELSKKIAEERHLTEEEIHLAAIIGLLHDYARFKQWTEYQTFNDSKSFDHGDEAVKLLFDSNEIKKYYSKEKNYQKIKDAIKNHNKYEIDKYVVDKTLCEIIRDADKIDIFYILTEYVLTEDNQPISEKVTEMFYNHKEISHQYTNNDSERIVKALAMLYDINDKIAYKIIYENNYLDIMLYNLKNREKYRQYFEYIKNYIKERID